MKDKIVLLGYMGSGKSTLGSVLALKLGYKFIDLDDFIEAIEQKDIKMIFEEHGAIYFRKVERLALEQVLNQKEKTVIALGGGTPCYYNNMQLINLNSTSIYLNMSVKELTDRLWEERHHRPLIAGIRSIEELQEFIGKHLFERSAFYQEAHISLLIKSKTVNDVLDDILKALA